MPEDVGPKEENLEGNQRLRHVLESEREEDNNLKGEGKEIQSDSASRS